MFNATAKDVCKAIHDFTKNTVVTVTMPYSGDQQNGSSFVTLIWPPEFKAEDVNMDTFCEAIHRLNIKGRPVYANEAHHHDE